MGVRYAALAIISVVLIACGPPTPTPAPQFRSPSPAIGVSSTDNRQPTTVAIVSTAVQVRPSVTIPPSSISAPLIVTASQSMANATVTFAPATASAPPPANVAAQRKEATVSRVVDGDTVRLRIDGREEPVRLIGINTPESVDPRRPVECLGKEASAKAAEILTPGMMVQIEADPTQDTRDRFGRLLLYVWMPDGRLFNDTMIQLGYATEYTFQTPYRYQAQFRTTQRAATSAKRGLWADDACAGQIAPSRSSTAPAAIASTPAPAKPTSVPKPALVPVAKPAATATAAGTSAPARTGCDPSYPGVCIPPYPPDLDCGQIAFRRFVVLPPDPHRFDGNKDGIGCE